MITEQGMLKISEAIYGLMKEIRVVFDDGSVRTVPIHKHVVTADEVKLMGLLDSTVTGQVRLMQVVDSEGVVILERPHAYVKTEVYGLLTVFRVRITEVN